MDSVVDIYYLFSLRTLFMLVCFFDCILLSQPAQRLLPQIAIGIETTAD